jgi:alpha-ketoglutarate-dependent taurine dioxygenase
MSVATKTKMQAEQIKPQIGSRILNTKEELLSGEIAGEIRELLEARGVLVFPKIGFTSDEQVEFTKTLGTFAPERGDGEGITKITLDAKENPMAAEYLKGSLYWHIDGTRNDVPILASLLSCIVPSPKGTGNTGFANTYSAYDALSEDKKAEYEQYKVIHGPWQSLFYYEPEPSLAKLEGYMAIGEQVLPLVWKHKSGRKSLVIGCTSVAVEGKSPLESAKIIHGLRDWATGPDFTYSHEWDVGDLVIWDNTGTMHRAEAYDPNCGRMMHRTKLEGEEAFAYA